MKSNELKSISRGGRLSPAARERIIAEAASGGTAPCEHVLGWAKLIEQNDEARIASLQTHLKSCQFCQDEVKMIEHYQKCGIRPTQILHEVATYFRYNPKTGQATEIRPNALLKEVKDYNNEI